MNKSVKDIAYSRQKAHFIRYSYVEDMEKFLLAFESKISDKGIKVKWIDTEEELTMTLAESLPKQNYNKVCIDYPELTEFLAEDKNRIKEVSVHDCEKNNDSAEVLITKADFAVVESGSIVLLNKQSKNILNKVQHIFFILDINMLIPRLADLETILNLYSINHDNQLLPHDIKICSAPFKRIIAEEFQSTKGNQFTSENVDTTLLLYNNGITDILEDNKVREALYCIHCDKCKSVCPVYAINKENSPIAVAKNNCSTALKSNIKPIFEQTTLCGNCDKICPVRIPFSDLFIHEMETAENHQDGESGDTLFKDFMKRTKMNQNNKKLFRFIFLRKYFSKNKLLYNYFSALKGDFFNVRWREAKKEQERDQEGED